MLTVSKLADAKTTSPIGERCRDTLADDAPPTLRTCREYADWRAKEAGDLLPRDEADLLALFPLGCGLDKAFRKGGSRFGGGAGSPFSIDPVDWSAGLW
jgi:hypothetical protein